MNQFERGWVGEFDGSLSKKIGDDVVVSAWLLWDLLEAS